MNAVDDFVIARNPDASSSLPFLLLVPVGSQAVVLKAREIWPRTSKVYCHPAEDWPSDPDVIDRVPVRECRRRGAAIDLVLARTRENRSQFVFANARGREVVFWQSARTARQARPNVRIPTKRASGERLVVLVDSHERYPWRFGQQQCVTERRALRAGDYAVEVDETVVAAVERKSLADLVSTLTSGKLRYLLADLSTVRRAAVVVEDKYSALFKLERVQPSIVVEGLAEAQVRFASIPIVFCENRAIAQEWSYRFLGAAFVHARDDHAARQRALELVPALTEERPTTAQVRAWASQNSITVPDRGRLRPEVWDAYRSAHPEL
ncbi:MAG: ERCC4 domain-containing protein [Actinomycetota bacterium]